MKTPKLNKLNAQVDEQTRGRIGDLVKQHGSTVKGVVIAAIAVGLQRLEGMPESTRGKLLCPDGRIESNRSRGPRKKTVAK